MPTIKRIGVLTGGGDAPGLNAVIRAVVKTASNSGMECIGLEDSFDGLIEPGRSRALTPRDVTGILRLGGTILGTTNRGNPFASPVETSDGVRDYSDRCVEMFHKMGLGALIVIGGDGTLAIAHQFCIRGIPIVGVPKTIDNDIVGTTNCFGSTPPSTSRRTRSIVCTSPREAHRRIMVVEVMGRYAGWIALYAGVAGGADAILIPEIPFDINIVCEQLAARDRWGARFSIVVVAEGAFPKGGEISLVQAAHGAASSGSVASARRCARRWRSNPARRRAQWCSVTCSAAARRRASIVCSRRASAAKAVELVKRGEFGTMVAYAPPNIVARRLDEVVGKTKTVPMDHDLLLTAKALGVTFGD